jgi:tetratricopeptide (TPR) repeat protein
MRCPRCGFAEAADPACARCGVVFAKLRERPEPAVRREEPAPSGGSAGSWLKVAAPVLLLLGGIAAAGHWRKQAQAPPAAAPPAGSVRLPSSAAPVRNDDLPPVLVVRPPAAPVVLPDAAGAGIAAADMRVYDDLVAALQKRRPIQAADVEAAAALQARYPSETPAQKLYTELLLLRADQLATARRTAEAITTLRRAASLPWADARVRSALLGLLLSASDWPATEAYASECLRLDPRDSEACYALGYALFRQDRNREAIDALKGCDAGAPGAALMARLQKGAADEGGMTERRLAHFHVRYDGDEHEGIGREVLRMLERHYATLVITLDHEPRSTIPVILFSREAYFDANGAPAWSGGNYDNIDGRIRVPIGGLSERLDQQVDAVLLHEVTHAFIADKSGGVAPRDIHEGLAQYMEGHRIESRLDSRTRTALANGELRGVGGFYIGALSFVEYLLAVRGQGGMNDLLKAMDQTHSVDQAFQQVHGQSYAAVQKAWRQRLQQQYGG